MSEQASVVDLFCGAGGLTFGLEKAGLHVAEGVDVDPACKFPYEQNTNARFVLKDARQYTSKDLVKAWGKAKTKILVGCAPCQPFSTYAQGPRGDHKRKWVLLNQFSKLALESMPHVVSMENVSPLQQTTAFRRLVASLKRADYHVWESIVDCRDFGAPQMRRRLVLLASRLGPIALGKPTHSPAEWRTVHYAIAKLSPLSAGEIDQNDPLHKTSALSPVNLKRIRASVPGGTWKDWPASLVADCHKRITGKTYPAVYGRMEWHKPSPTITGQAYGFGNGRFGHPEQDRALSLREAAILQTFPKAYAFVPDGEPVHMKAVGRLIGNAVPPLLGKAIGRAISHHIAIERK